MLLLTNTEEISARLLIENYRHTLALALQIMVWLKKPQCLMGTKNEKKTIEKRNKKVAQIIRRLLIYLSDEILLA